MLLGELNNDVLHEYLIHLLDSSFMTGTTYDLNCLVVLAAAFTVFDSIIEDFIQVQR